MTKRKADIFTLAESVPNWFVARGSTVAPPEEVKGVVNDNIKTSSEARDPTVAAQSTVTESVAGWAEASPHTRLSGVGPYGAASWLEVEQVGREPADVAGTTNTGVATKHGP